MGKKCRMFEIGEKIGVVDVVSRIYNEVRKEWEYICRCRCGNEFRARRDHLLKPRQGCRACINKVRADIDLAGTISEEDFQKRVDQKNFEKMQKRVFVEQRKAERSRLREERLSELEEKRKRFKDSRLTSPCWVGQKFGRLTVIDNCLIDGKTHWVLRCDCGNTVTKLAKFVKIGHYISCGCKSREISANAVYNERLYGIWNGMKDRCNNSNNPNYHNYGGRGISICRDWENDYRVFRKWAYENGWTEDMPEDHNDSLSIERINVNGNYEPSNCCFIPLREQSKNKRPYSECENKKTKKDFELIEINGKTKSLRDWQKFYNISDATMFYRKKVLKMSNLDALTTEKHDTGKLYGGKYSK